MIDTNGLEKLISNRLVEAIGTTPQQILLWRSWSFYVLRVLNDYPVDRSLLYEVAQGLRRMEITSAVAQGPNLGQAHGTLPTIVC